MTANKLLLSAVALILMSCGSSQLLYVPATQEQDGLDSLFREMPLLRDYQDLKASGLSELSFPISEIVTLTNFEGLIQVNAYVDSTGVLVGAKVVYPQNLGVDHLILPQLESGLYESASNLDGIETRYVVELKIPVYIQPIDTSEFNQWEATPLDERVFDTPPEPYGGYSAIQQRVVYPRSEREAGIEGDVLIGFFLDSSGRMGNFKVYESLGYHLDKSALDAIRATKWKPATLDGVNIPFGVSVPIVFRLY